MICFACVSLQSTAVTTLPVQVCLVRCVPKGTTETERASASRATAMGTVNRVWLPLASASTAQGTPEENTAKTACQVSPTKFVSIAV